MSASRDVVIIGGGHNALVAAAYRAFTRPRRRPAAAFAAFAALGMVAAGTVVDLRPPAPRDTDAPATAFSADRAYRHVEQVARQPHPAYVGLHQAGARREVPGRHGHRDRRSAGGLHRREPRQDGAHGADEGEVDQRADGLVGGHARAAEDAVGEVDRDQVDDEGQDEGGGDVQIGHQVQERGQHQ